MVDKKQEILILYLSNSSLASKVIGWARYYSDKKKIGMPGDNDKPPYDNGIDAIHDGWRLFQTSQIEQHKKGEEFRTGYLKYEFFFEKIK
tara:strand:+ start:116 stop:385 length:270 start_codon:yes stop_codon:yes gene_type:complete